MAIGFLFSSSDGRLHSYFYTLPGCGIVLPDLGAARAAIPPPWPRKSSPCGVNCIPPIASLKPPSSVPPPSAASGSALISTAGVISIPRRREHAAPGDLLRLDIKAMTRYQSVSIRGDGRRRGRPQFAGWQALHIAIDDHSRLAFSRLLPNQTVDSALAFLRAALAFYAEHGIAIRRLLTDNGACYRSHRFRAACEELDIRPYTPRTNRKAERFIQTALREWAYVRHYTNSEERDQQLSPWLHYYNFARPHGSLGYAPPISRAAP